MSPTAAGLAATLHALLAAFLLWGTTAKNLEVPEQAIEVTMEEPPPKSEAPKTEPTPQPTPPPPAAQTPPATQPAPPVEAKPTVTDKTKTTPLGMAPPKER